MRLSTTVFGDGPREVGLVHGLGQSGALWEDFAAPLAASGHTVIAVDLRGHGDSPRGSSYLVDDFAADLVDTLPTGLDVLACHSLGGAIVPRAIGRLAPKHALYLDPGFRLALPTSGLRARLFWAAPLVGLLISALGRRDQRRRAEAAHTPRTRELTARAKRGFDRSMISAVYRDIAHHPFPAAAPEVPSTVVLSGEGEAVVPADLAADLARHGWDVRRLSELTHEFWLENADRTTEAVADLF
ncbi:MULTISPECIES: alpha/beta fold hydrolase [unclassified Saccharopolyspora]|uniref:alpha/beta fold hydrolase n=1 Tax=unclassified Saccharopolyspora TaxID=2646250 RepID=UPI001CD29C4F|nr:MULTISPECIES: alpha/beta fold hydrolase [unclassified Saccharopolyspora]MCA1186915.1 alpha/beta fold hydrolase [Saccharopolyspora sp. 6T]MCA1193322.1 alpha/beta fold hydrolase [Saccharopolyspora sp. 6V]MCA1281399.1 alpha/beta fold hydrolase [Saccharopolyspora sp. 7B]